MQHTTVFYSDPREADFDRSTSLFVIDDIVQYNRGFFEKGQPEGHPGFRAARIARAPDARLTTSDIAAWNDLVECHLLPAFDAEQAALEAEAARFPEVPQPYLQAVAMCLDRQSAVARRHEDFMKAYRPHL